MKLTKDEILQGINKVKEVDITGFPKDLGENGTVTFEIRPLSDGELTQAENKIVEGIDINPNQLNSKDIKAIKKMKDSGASKQQMASKLKNKFGSSLDIGRLQKQEKEMTYFICSKGLSVGDNNWSVDDARNLPKGVPDKLAEEIRKISDFELMSDKEEEELKSFRK